MLFSMRAVIIAAGLSLSLSVQAALDAQQRAIVLIGANVARADISALENALNDALDAGLTVNQTKEVLVHSYAYLGFPRALNGINAFIRVTEARADDHCDVGFTRWDRPSVARPYEYQSSSWPRSGRYGRFCYLASRQH